MIVLPVGLSFAGLFLILLCKARFAAYFAVFFVLALAIVIPSHSPPREVLVLAAAGAVLILLAAVFRSLDAIRGSVPNVWLIAFLTFSSTVMAVESERSYALFVALTAFLYILFSLFVSGPGQHGTRVLVIAVPIFVVIEFALSFSEEFMGVKALWPQTNGSDFITHRYNPVAPWLAGRAMGSTSQPIPLGIIAGLLCLLCVWMAFKRSKVFWVFATLAAVVLLFSGTRSSFLALVVCLAFWFALRAGLKSVPVYFAVGAVLIGVFWVADGLSLLGFSNFSSTDSYLHRADVLGFIPTLADRPLNELFFGSGYSSIGVLLQSSSFGGGSGILVFDQEFVRTVVATGVVGLVLLVLAIVEGFRRGNLPSRMILLFMAVTFLSFDGLSWNMSTILFVLAASGPVLPETEKYGISMNKSAAMTEIGRARLS